MNKKNALKRLKGSGILVVTLTAIAFSIYTATTYSDSEHFGIMIHKYEKNNREYYEQSVDSVDDFYEEMMTKNNIN